MPFKLWAQFGFLKHSNICRVIYWKELYREGLAHVCQRHSPALKVMFKLSSTLLAVYRVSTSRSFFLQFKDLKAIDSLCGKHLICFNSCHGQIHWLTQCGSSCTWCPVVLESQTFFKNNMLTIWLQRVRFSPYGGYWVYRVGLQPHYRLLDAEYIEGMGGSLGLKQIEIEQRGMKRWLSG